MAQVSSGMLRLRGRLECRFCPSRPPTDVSPSASMSLFAARTAAAHLASAARTTSNARLRIASAAAPRHFSTSLRIMASGPPVIQGEGAKPGEVPSDEQQATGLERFELLGRLQGVDVFDMEPLESHRLGTTKEPIIVQSLVSAPGRWAGQRRCALPPSRPHLAYASSCLHARTPPSFPPGSSDALAHPLEGTTQSGYTSTRTLSTTDAQSVEAVSVRANVRQRTTC